MNTSNRMVWGILFITFGVLFLFDNFGIVSIGDAVHKYWPALLVIIGVSMLLRQGRSSGNKEFPSPVQEAFERGPIEGSRMERISYSSVFGNVDVCVDPIAFKGGLVSTVFGDAIIDMTQAALADGEQLLKISGVFGNVRVSLPRGVDFSVSATTLFGGLECNGQRREGFSQTLYHASPGYSTAVKKIHIQASQVFGNVVVRN